MSRDLDLVQLRTFVAVVDCGGFGRAAASLHLSQPTVSQHVRGLERSVHTTLFTRDGRSSRLTPAGERLLGEARRILAVHDEALGRLDLVLEPTIVIGSTETAAEQVLPELLGALRAAFPGRQTQFHIDRSTQMIEGVAKGTLDLAVVLGLGSDTPGTKVGSLPLGWYSSRSWTPPLLGEAWPLVAYVEPCGMRQRALTVLGAHDHRVEVVAESTSLEGVIAAARAGLGLAVLPDAGTVPDGLVRRTELPALGDITMRLISRRGIDVEIEHTALTTLESFFAGRAQQTDEVAHES
ncbi:LysR family transcriptional regulator [Aeromicrobium alkaliterrae]|uniref:LysR family transcriptional regulator n=1 Tax=Aeromicrobium alkaliterrae TaxID=302168 RepID=A0ABN2K4J5_9ACTN